MLVWLQWIPVVMGFLIIYAFLAIVTSPVLALLVTLLLPVKAVVVGQYAVALLPAIVLASALRRPDFRRFLILWMTTALLVLWRPALGWPAALTTLALVGIVVLLEKRAAWVPAGASLALVLGLFPAGLLITEIVWGGDTYAALLDFLGLVGHSGVGGFGALETFAGMQGVTSFLQQLLPVLAVICVLYFFLRKFVRRQAFYAPGYVILYLVVFSLGVPARTGAQAGRQIFDPSLLLLMVALMPFFIVQGAFRPRQIGRSTWLVAVLVLSAFLGAIDIYHLLGVDPAGGRLRTWKVGEPRVLFDPRPHQALVEFLAKGARGRGDLSRFHGFGGSLCPGSPTISAARDCGFPHDFRVPSTIADRHPGRSTKHHGVALGCLPIIHSGKGILFRASNGGRLLPRRRVHLCSLPALCQGGEVGDLERAGCQAGQAGATRQDSQSRIGPARFPIGRLSLSVGQSKTPGKPSVEPMSWLRLSKRQWCCPREYR